MEGLLARRPGGAGGVFSAFHLASGARVAVDVVPWPLTEDAAIGGRLYGELQALRLLAKHPNVAPLVESGTDLDGSRYVVTELGDLRPLAELLDEWRRPGAPMVAPARATQLLAPVLQVLGAAHRVGVCHGALSAAAVYLGPAPGPAAPGGTGEKVLVHGFFLEPGSEAAGAAPRAAPQGAQADLRGVAAILYELLTSRAPGSLAGVPGKLRGLPPEAAPGTRLAALLQIAEQALDTKRPPRFTSIDEFGKLLLQTVPPQVPVAARAELPRGSVLLPALPSMSLPGLSGATQPPPLQPLEHHPLPKAGLTGELRQVSLLDLMQAAEEKPPGAPEILAVSRRPVTLEMEALLPEETLPAEELRAAAVTPRPAAPPAEPEDHLSWPDIEVLEQSRVQAFSSGVAPEVLAALPAGPTAAEGRIAALLPVHTPTAPPSARTAPGPAAAPAVIPLQHPPLPTPARLQPAAPWPAPDLSAYPVVPAAPAPAPLLVPTAQQVRIHIRPQAALLLIWGVLGIVCATGLMVALLYLLTRPLPPARTTPGPSPPIAVPAAGPPGTPPRPAAPAPLRPAVLHPPPACPAGMVGLPGVRTYIGSPDGVGEDNEHPRHLVELSPFCLDRYEVRNADYKRCVHRHACTPQGRRSARDAPEQPAVRVSHRQAAAYCGFAGKRLPTEAEWEFAAAGLSGRDFPWGDEPPGCERSTFAADPRAAPDACAEFCRGSRDPRCLARCLEASQCAGVTAPRPAPVGTHERNGTPEGIYDLGGNVAEWVADVYAERYLQKTGDGAPPKDPLGPDPAGSGHERVVRGGGWLNPAALLRTRARDHLDPQLQDMIGVGFRCAASGEQAAALLSKR